MEPSRGLNDSSRRSGRLEPLSGARVPETVPAGHTSRVIRLFPPCGLSSATVRDSAQPLEQRTSIFHSPAGRPILAEPGTLTGRRCSPYSGDVATRTASLALDGSPASRKSTSKIPVEANPTAGIKNPKRAIPTMQEPKDDAWYRSSRLRVLYTSTTASNAVARRAAVPFPADFPFISDNANQLPQGGSTGRLQDGVSSLEHSMNQSLSLVDDTVP